MCDFVGLKIQNLDMYNFLTMQFYVQLAIGAVLLSLFFIIVRKKSDIKILLNDIFSRKIFSYKRRASRAEYWFIYIMNFTLLSMMIPIGAYYRLDRDFALFFTASLVILIILVTIRRLHDLNKSGWWTIVIIPWWQIFIFTDAMTLSFIILPFILGVISGTENENKYDLSKTKDN